MKFLVILICLVVNYLWLKDFDRFNDAWFFKFRSWTLGWAFNRTTGFNASDLTVMSLAGLILYVVPLITLSLVLFMFAGVAVGLGTMLIHILVLLIAFDRTQPGHLAKTFLGYWRKGEIEASYLYLQETLSIPESIPADDERQIHEFFNKQFTYRCFDKMFVMFFWYMAAGPWGVAFCYITYQLRDCQLRDCASNYSAAAASADLISSTSQSSPAIDTVTEWLDKLLWVIEWLPLRLLGLTFSLVGNFVQCFERVKDSLWDIDTSAADQLYGYIYCALAGTISAPSNEPEEPADHRQEEGDSVVVTTPGNADDLDTATEDAAYRHRTALETEALQALLERSQIIWLCVIALTAVFL